MVNTSFPTVKNASAPARGAAAGLTQPGSA